LKANTIEKLLRTVVLEIDNKNIVEFIKKLKISNSTIVSLQKQKSIKSFVLKLENIVKI
jgi:hypothetical protein